MKPDGAVGSPRYDEVEVGDALPERRHLLTRTDLVRYAGASGDFNPMHHDEVLALAAGQPSVFGHGMYSMALLGTALTAYAGAGSVVSYRVRFTRQTWPGETLISRGRVADKRVEGGRRLVEVECSLESSSGETKVSGSALLELD